MSSIKERTVEDLIDALESFKRHHGKDASVRLFSFSEDSGAITEPVYNVTEVTEEVDDFGIFDGKATLLLW